MTGIGLSAAIAWTLISAPPDVSVSTLSGEQHAGVLTSITREAVKISKDGAEKSVSLSDLMEVRFPAAATGPATTPENAPPVVGLVELSDESRMQATRVVVSKRDVTIESPLWGSLKVPLGSVASIRFAAQDQQVDKSWDELSERERKDDMLVIRKGEVLDHLDGAVGDLDETTVHFVLDNEDVPVKREKIFGILYASRKAPAQQAVCEAIAHGGDRLKLRQVSWNGEQWKASLLAGGELTLPEGKLSALDFSLGKLKSLSDLEWRDLKLTAYWDTETDRAMQAPRKDVNGDGKPLRLGVPLRPNSKFLVPKVFPRGVCLHSKTQLKYRINGDYRRFQAMIGIAFEMHRHERGEVDLKISGDGKTLLETSVSWNEPLRPIDLDVTDVRDLEIVVDLGKDQLPEGDELILGDAKLVK